MHAHIPDEGGFSQLQVLASAIDRVLLSIDDLVVTPLAPAERMRLFARLAELRLLWRTYEVLASNFEQASREVIDLIARLEESRAIAGDEANELMRPFEQALGEMYVHTMAARPE